MRTETGHATHRFVEYDSLRRRVWILGQRCHHGATGAVVVAGACLGMIVPRRGARSLLAVAVTGGALMAHDWKDHSVWFQRGRGA